MNNLLTAIMFFLIILHVGCASPSLPPEGVGSKNDTAASLADGEGEHDIADGVLVDGSAGTSDSEVVTVDSQSGDAGTAQEDSYFCNKPYGKYATGCPCNKNDKIIICCTPPQMWTSECLNTSSSGVGTWLMYEGCGCRTEENGVPCSSPYAKPPIPNCN